MITLYNTLTKKLDTLQAQSSPLKMYSCGPTTYDFMHVGNARALVTADIIYRTLLFLGQEVIFVRNFTDIDDKIINEAKKNNSCPLEHSQKYIQEALIDMNSLGLLPPTHTPKVSESLPEIIALIEDLLKNNHAYVREGEVLFDIASFSSYGKLSGQKQESLSFGKRIEVKEHKRNPGDFVLWKPISSSSDTPYWESPWGKGRPGWHIECSAMAKKYLGPTLDIHHGDIDLIFPHHENEIAQSEGANKALFGKHWCHNEFLNFNTEKMSKSLGNVITIRKFVESHSGPVLRHLLCSVHYRSKIDWSEELIEKSRQEVFKIHSFAKTFYQKGFLGNPIESSEILPQIEQLQIEFNKELANDFNVPACLGKLFTLRHLYYKEYTETDFSKAPSQKVFKAIDRFFHGFSQATGLLHLENLEDVINFFTKKSSLTQEEQEKLLQERQKARLEKNWKKADEIRDTFLKNGLQIKDGPEGNVFIIPLS